ncbi:MAG: DUF4838 domain-containing protein [Bacteroidota bacterium]
MVRILSANFLLSLLFALTTATTNAALDKFVLTNKGATNHVIEVPLKPTAQEQRAADLIKEYIYKISGAKLQIVTEDTSIRRSRIVVGRTIESVQNFDTSMNVLGRDGFRIVTRGKTVFLVGGPGNGVVYAATAFLEDQLGCRKFSKEEEFVPKESTTIVRLMDSTYIPAKSIRIVNGPMAEDPDVKAWRRVTTISDDWRDGEWKGYYVHTFSRLVPPASYFESHPEYFGLINGERKPYAQLCLTNPEVLAVVIDTLRKEMAAHPSVRYWSVSPNDDYEYCRCEKCAQVDDEEGSPSGLLLRFVNKVAEAFPEKTITTLAYSYTRQAPKITRPSKNVMVTLCSIELDRSKPITEVGGGESFVKDLKEWNAISSNLMIWDYEVQFTNYISVFPLFHTLQPNLQLFNRNGARAHFQQCYVENGVEFAQLKLFVLSKLLWNDGINMDETVADFMNTYYGPAGPWMKRYFDKIHQAEIRSGQSLDIYGTPAYYSKTLLSEELTDEYDLFFDSAAVAVSKDPVLLERVRITQLPLLFGKMEIAKTDLFGERGWFYKDGDDFKPRKEKTALLDTFTAVCRRNNIVYMNENGLKVELYRTSTERFLDVKVKGNLAFEKNVACSSPPDQRYFLKGPASLTDGVKGTERYKMNWLGWEGMDMSFTIDLGKIQTVKSAAVSTMHYPQSWIVRPDKVICSVSEDGITFRESGSISSDEDASKEPLIRSFDFSLSGKARYVRFEITGTKTLPAWHTYTGHKSWVFVDEAEVR